MDRTADGSAVTLAALLSNLGECKIPLFQRGYSWKREHVSRLLSDEWLACMTQGRTRDVFLGSIVTQSSKQTDSQCNIIDGQQRLTTIHLIVISLRELYLIGRVAEGNIAFWDKLLLTAKV